MEFVWGRSSFALRKQNKLDSEFSVTRRKFQKSQQHAIREVWMIKMEVDTVSSLGLLTRGQQGKRRGNHTSTTSFYSIRERPARKKSNLLLSARRETAFWTA